MRNNKFRVWDIYNKRFCDGSFEIRIDGNLFNHDEYSIMQYIGIKDKNGKEICEGDIVKYFDSLCVIEYCSQTASFSLIGQSLDDEWSLGGDMWEDVEIVGNIFENPELK